MSTPTEGPADPEIAVSAILVTDSSMTGCALTVRFTVTVCGEFVAAESVIEIVAT